MNPISDEDLIAKMRNAIDFRIVSDSIADVSAFAIEKHEFRTKTTLPPDLRAKAEQQIKRLLWSRFEELDQRRREFIVSVFDGADKALQEVVEEYGHSKA